MKGKIQIKVVGPVGCGKSTVGQIIAKALADAGLNNVDFVSEEPDQLMVDSDQQNKRIDMIRNNPIEISEILTRREEVFKVVL